MQSDNEQDINDEDKDELVSSYRFGYFSLMLESAFTFFTYFKGDKLKFSRLQTRIYKSNWRKRRHLYTKPRQSK